MTGNHQLADGPCEDPRWARTRRTFVDDRRSRTDSDQVLAPTSGHTVSDHAIARTLADEAGRLLMRLRTDATLLSDPAVLRRAGDNRSNDLLLRRLAELCPGDAVLSEESGDDVARLTAERVWIIDPLDGTREFGEPPRDDWAVHVALSSQGQLTAGAVAQPAAGRTFGTDQPPTLPVREPSAPIRLAVSRSRPPAFVAELAEALGGALLPMGSAGVKVVAVLTGVADVYVHAGGQFEWDSAAPVAVARAAGLHTSRVSGAPLCYNQPEPNLPDVLVCHPEVSDRVLGALVECLPDPTAG